VLHTGANGMNASAGGANFLVLFHAVDEQRDGLCLEVDVTVQRQ